MNTIFELQQNNYKTVKYHSFKLYVISSKVELNVSVKRTVFIDFLNFLVTE